MTITHDCALVTGASSGLGEEFAMQLAARVRHLILVARREEMLESVASRIAMVCPECEVSVLVADLGQAADRLRLLGILERMDWTPDLLVNNAGLGDYGEFATSEWSRVEAILKVNVEALTHLSHGLLPGMIAQGRGGVINVSSLASLLPIPDFAVYAASKAYVTSFSEALRLELRDHGIPVLAVCPGPVHTEFGAVAQRGGGERQIPGREWFYVAREQVVAESLEALAEHKARVFPHLKTFAAALVISALPILALRAFMGMRPRK